MSPLGRRSRRGFWPVGWFSCSFGSCFCSFRFVCSSRSLEDIPLYWNQVEGNWKQVRGKVKEQWGKLTDDDLDVIGGRRDQLEGKIQERYGYAKDQVSKEVENWYNRQTWH